MLTLERAEELLKYDPLTGKLFWKMFRNSQAQQGKEAGSMTSDGYIMVGVDGKYYPAHCIIWLLEFGYYPVKQIDHADHNRSNNLMGNLEEVGFVKNQLNKKKFKNNTSGFTGVSVTPLGKFIARAFIFKNGKRTSKSLGTYNIIEDAVEARNKYLRDNGFHVNHGV